MLYFTDVLLHALQYNYIVCINICIIFSVYFLCVQLSVEETALTPTRTIEHTYMLTVLNEFIALVICLFISIKTTQN